MERKSSVFSTRTQEAYILFTSLIKAPSAQFILQNQPKISNQLKKPNLTKTKKQNKTKNKNH